MDDNPPPQIVILLGAPFTEQNYYRSGVPYLMKRCHVVVLDCMRWVAPGSDRIQFARYHYEPFVQIGSAEDFENEIQRLRPAFALDFVGGGNQYPKIQKLLRRYGVQFVIQKTGNVPAVSNKTRLISLMLTHPIQSLGKMWSRIRFLGRKPERLDPDVALLAGKLSLDSWTSRARKIIWVNSNDYNKYQFVNETRLVVNGVPGGGRYVLFLDDCIALASDYTLLGIKAPVRPAEYFAGLREAFDKIEAACGAPVVVAAHPNGKGIPGYGELFGDRRVVYDQTAELTSDCLLAISHISTALSFAVLWRKPILIFTSKSLERSYYGALVAERSRQLLCPLVRMEASPYQYISAWQEAQKIDQPAYQRYVENYIVTNDTRESSPWANFLNYTQQEKPTA